MSTQLPPQLSTVPRFMITIGLFFTTAFLFIVFLTISDRIFGSKGENYWWIITPILAITIVAAIFFLF